MWLLKGISDKVKEMAIVLNELTPEERLDVFSCFCNVCGENDPDCQCWNDD